MCSLTNVFSNPSNVLRRLVRVIKIVRAVRFWNRYVFLMCCQGVANVLLMCCSCVANVLPCAFGIGMCF